MTIIEPSVELIQESNPFKKIEMAGRTCYKSEANITDESALKFYQRLADNKHTAMLEHATFIFDVSGCDYCYELGCRDEITAHKFLNITSAVINGETRTLLSGNLRAINESNIGDLLYSLYRYDPKLVYNYSKYSESQFKRNMDLHNGDDRTDLWQFPVVKLSDYDNLTEEEIAVHTYTTMKFICDRGVSHELVRHRPFSFAQESTRYVRYTTKKSLHEYNCNNNHDIINAYNDGYSMKAIAEQSCYTEWEIRKLLIENQVEIRGLNNKGLRQENYFDQIDTAEKAYLLGLIQTDGNVRTNKNSFGLTIAQHKDYSWYILNMLHNFSEYVCISDDKNCHQLLIGSKKIVNKIIEYGIVPNKTKIQTAEHIITLWNTIPLEFKGDFIRGLIDGDGCVRYFTQKNAINESVNISLCSVSETLIDIVKQYIEQNFNYTCGKYKQNNVYRLVITDWKKSIEIGKALYKNFKYPYGHPKKASEWIMRLQQDYPIVSQDNQKFQIIKPQWMFENYYSNSHSVFTFYHSMLNAEESYINMINNGRTPQEARAVLPNAVKTEIIVTGNGVEWNHFFNLRHFGTTGKPHPDMQVVADMAYEIYKNI